MMLKRIKPYCNQSILSILFLYFSSGLPLALTSSTLQAWYTTAGVSLMTIGMLTLVGQPYVYKFLWAPLVDRFIPGNIGRRRSWILLMQLALAIGLAVMALLNPAYSPWLLAGLAMAVAFCSATQDIAIDAYRTDLLPSHQRGMGAAMVALGYRVAMLVSGALALVMADLWGWRVTYLIMAGLMFSGIFITLSAPRPQELSAPKTLRKAVIAPLKEFLSREYAIAILVFIVIYKLSDAFALSLNTPFLLRYLAFSLTVVGSVSKTVGLMATIIGSLVGGFLMPRLGLYRSLMVFGILQIVSNLAYAVLAIIGKNYIAMALTMFFEFFCGGLSTVAFIVFLTALCDKHYTATQYALFSAVMAIGRVFVGPEAAAMVDHLGWALFYVWTFLLGIPALLLLWWLKYRLDFKAEKLIRRPIDPETILLFNVFLQHHQHHHVQYNHASWLLLTEFNRRVRF